MPELPEVETVVRALRPHILGQTVARVVTRAPKLRTPLGRAALLQIADGKPILDVRRRAKSILIEFENAHAWLIHFGMSGRIRLAPLSEPAQLHEHVQIDFANQQSLRFVDPRRFGQFEACALPCPGGEPESLSHMGPEPLARDFSARYLFEKSRKRATATKIFIMNQAIVVGVGNIYASEAMFRAGIRPTRKVGRLTREDCTRLVKAIKQVLRTAIKRGGTTIADFHAPDGSEGKFAIHLHVYHRDGKACHTCGAAIKKIVLGNRSTFYCPQCQR